MSNADLIAAYWQAMDQRDWNQLKSFFADSATVEWANTNELFVDINNFIRANSEYPGDWSINLERIEETADKIITVTKVALREQDVSLYGVSFFELANGKIAKLKEYWGDNGPAPEWRQKLNLSILASSQ